MSSFIILCTEDPSSELHVDRFVSLVDLLCDNVKRKLGFCLVAGVDHDFLDWISTHQMTLAGKQWTVEIMEQPQLLYLSQC